MEIKRESIFLQISWYIGVQTYIFKFYLMAQKLAKWRVFLPCYCHKIYRVEAGSTKIPIVPSKFELLWICKTWGNFLKNWYFANNCLVKVQIWEFFCTHCSYYCYYLPHSKFCFYQINFHFNTDFRSQFCMF